jgi:hypothetical protein
MGISQWFKKLSGKQDADAIAHADEKVREGTAPRAGSESDVEASLADERTSHLGGMPIETDRYGN